MLAPRIINSLGALLLIGILVQLFVWVTDNPHLQAIGLGLCQPFLPCWRS